MVPTLLRGLVIWSLLVEIAIFNGTIREKALQPLLGSEIALPLDGALFSLLIFSGSFLLMPFIGQDDGYTCLLVGLLWVTLTIAFQFYFGHFGFAEKWHDIFQVFSIMKGDLFLVVLSSCAVSSWPAAKNRGLI